MAEGFVVIDLDTASVDRARVDEDVGDDNELIQSCLRNDALGNRVCHRLGAGV
jgi:hypothetical protein